MSDYSNQFPISPKKKPTTGRLWYNGKVILADRPFAFLQFRKRELIAQGCNKNLFKITY